MGLDTFIIYYYYNNDNVQSKVICGCVYNVLRFYNCSCNHQFCNKLCLDELNNDKDICEEPLESHRVYCDKHAILSEYPYIMAKRIKQHEVDGDYDELKQFYYTNPINGKKLSRDEIVSYLANCTYDYYANDGKICHLLRNALLLGVSHAKIIAI